MVPDTLPSETVNNDNLSACPLDYVAPNEYNDCNLVKLRVYDGEKSIDLEK
jgi:hypothetical protein